MYHRFNSIEADDIAAIIAMNLETDIIQPWSMLPCGHKFHGSCVSTDAYLWNKVADKTVVE